MLQPALSLSLYLSLFSYVSPGRACFCMAREHDQPRGGHVGMLESGGPGTRAEELTSGHGLSG